VPLKKMKEDESENLEEEKKDETQPKEEIPDSLQQETTISNISA
jgi:hypothetical protein